MDLEDIYPDKINSYNVGSSSLKMHPQLKLDDQKLVNFISVVK